MRSQVKRADQPKVALSLLARQEFSVTLVLFLSHSFDSLAPVLLQAFKQSEPEKCQEEHRNI